MKNCGVGGSPGLGLGAPLFLFCRPSLFEEPASQKLSGPEGHPCHSMAFKNANIVCEAANSRFTLLRVHQGLDLERHAVFVAPHWKNSGPPRFGLAIPFLLILSGPTKLFGKLAH